jgi:outer membrane receptor protein involved in Fe transport
MQASYGDDSSSANQDLRNAIRFALATGAGAAAALGPQHAVAADETSAQGLEEVVVTGTRIRRLDTETASPVVSISATQIEASGLQTAGELLAQLPTVSGAAVNPQVNNGGGFGEANVELRGLDAKRTLVLLNGRRLGVVGQSGAVDVNQIPVGIIDHVEVLKEGAGAVYGSDAIAGVVNFITRKRVDGLELHAETGQTSQSDGRHTSVSALFGSSTDRMDIIVGGSYTKQEEVSAGDREFSKFARYLYSGGSGQFETLAGSSRIPNGRVFLPAGSPQRAFYIDAAHPTGCSSVTRLPDATGTSMSDYRCFTGADLYNYQPFNLLMTPQERGAVFATANYKITDDIEAYAEILYNRTHSGFTIAPLPFDATLDDVVISANNIYNPFGLDFGGNNLPNPNFRLRLESLGTRFSQTTSDSKAATAGLKGKLFNTGWDWDANMSYARLDQDQRVNGYLYFPQLQSAVGPSFVDGTGAHCGTAAAPIAGCTPINIFNAQDPATIASLQQISTAYMTTNAYVSKGAALNFNGKLFTMPAGDAQMAVGGEYRKLEGRYEADKLVEAQPPLYIKCIISQEACTGNSRGEYDDKELYAEVFLPLLKDMPGANALNLDIGVRHSNYSLFGSTTKAQFKVEYRPIRDLLVRGTYAQVFRVPTIADISSAPAISNPTFNDPCYGLTQAAIDATPNLALACQGVPLDGSYSYTGTSQITSVILSNPNLKPETGDVITYGFVWQLPWVDNLSVSVDAWRYKLENLITNIDPNYAKDQCIDNANAYFCSLNTRYQSGPNQGEVQVFQQPTVNLGELKTNGVDFGLKYVLTNTRAGSFQFSVDTTYIDTYETVAAPGSAPQEVAGTYDRQFGNYARWRGTGQIGWALSSFDGLLSARYIHSLVVHTPATQSDPFAGLPNPDLQIPSVMYFDLTLGYTIQKTNTKFQLGVQNLADKDPPILYQNNVINANTDVSTYDLLGRRFFVTVSQKL